MSGELPLVLTPLSGSELAASHAAAAAWVAAHERALLELLSRHGALLFRGFALSSSEHFEGFVSSFGTFKNLPYEDSLSYAVRLPVGTSGRVCTTNEGKLGGMTVGARECRGEGGARHVRLLLRPLRCAATHPALPTSPPHPVRTVPSRAGRSSTLPVQGVFLLRDARELWGCHGRVAVMGARGGPRA